MGTNVKKHVCILLIIKININLISYVGLILVKTEKKNYLFNS